MGLLFLNNFNGNFFRGPSESAAESIYNYNSWEGSNLDRSLKEVYCIQCDVRASLNWFEFEPQGTNYPIPINKPRQSLYEADL